jgi:hypothetical protein
VRAALLDRREAQLQAILSDVPVADGTKTFDEYKRLHGDALSKAAELRVNPDMKGDAVVRQFGEKRLQEQGIPGIKYLDQGSRAAGDGSRNYVVFDDKLISILKRYAWVPGMAIPAAAMAEYQAQIAPQEYARGGPIRGIGGGQDDLIDAKLSDGEYVFSAQDVSDLGDGSNEAGARKLTAMRKLIRKQAGRKNTETIAPPQKSVRSILRAVR